MKHLILLCLITVPCTATLKKSPKIYSDLSIFALRDTLESFYFYDNKGSKRCILRDGNSYFMKYKNSMIPMTEKEASDLLKKVNGLRINNPSFVNRN